MTSASVKSAEAFGRETVDDPRLKKARLGRQDFVGRSFGAKGVQSGPHVKEVNAGKIHSL